MDTEANSPEPLWTVTAVISDHLRNGNDPDRQYTGTPVFAAGTRVYIGQVYGGMLENLHVIGRGRNASRIVSAVVGFEMLLDPQPKLVYSPARLKMLKRLDAFSTPNRSEAEDRADFVRRTRLWLAEEKASKQQPSPSE